MTDQPTSQLACNCPWDWVLCFSRECPRGKRFAEQQRAAHEATRKFCGDPMGCFEGAVVTDSYWTCCNERA
jgi:hypothetical protein